MCSSDKAGYGKASDRQIIEADSKLETNEEESAFNRALKKVAKSPRAKEQPPTPEERRLGRVHYHKYKRQPYCA